MKSIIFIDLRSAYQFATAKVVAVILHNSVSCFQIIAENSPKIFLPAWQQLPAHTKVSPCQQDLAVE